MSTRPRFDFTGRVALITGAASGVGRATAVTFATNGAWVLLMDRDRTGAEASLAQVRLAGGAGAVHVGDVTEAASVDAAVAAAVAARGRLDYAVNAAGIEGAHGDLLDEPAGLFDRVIDINLRGVWLCMRAEIRQMLTQSDGGAIVNLSSAAGLVGSQRCAAYGASKHAVIGLTKSVALQYAKRRIRVNAVCPAGVSTPMAARILATAPRPPASAGGAGYPLGRYSTPEEVADGILWLCSAGAGSVVGAAVAMDSGMTAT